MHVHYIVGTVWSVNGLVSVATLKGPSVWNMELGISHKYKGGNNHIA
jgi:hypothetical protein